MTTPLAKIFSAIDSVKRVLADRMSPAGLANTLEQTGANRAAVNALAEQAANKKLPASERAAAAEKVQQHYEDIAMSFNPAGMVLYHGGPQAIQKVLAEKLGATGQMQGPGFYASDLLNIPELFAIRASKPSSPGVISAFDFPDELAKTLLPLTDEALSQSAPAVRSKILSIMATNPLAHNKIKNALRFGYKEAKETNPAVKIDELFTGDLVDWTLNSAIGKSAAARMLADSGVTGKSWQYSKTAPDTATVVFPKYIDELRPIGNVTVDPMNQADYVQRLLEQVLANGGRQ